MPKNPNTEHIQVIRSIRWEINNPPIKISDLTELDKFRRVKYIHYYSKGTKTPFTEDGYITSWNETYIFVCFDTTGRGKACNPKDLIFDGEQPETIHQTNPYELADDIKDPYISNEYFN